MSANGNKGVFLLLGSNEGDRLANLSQARTKLQQTAGTIVVRSSIYQTAAWGKTDQPDFYNQVIGIETSLEPFQLLEVCLEVERSMGRKRIEKWGSRIIDIDILLYHQQVIDDESLKIPHPGLPFRRFALTPLHEVASGFHHPVLKSDIQSLLNACQDPLWVEKLELP